MKLFLDEERKDFLGHSCAESDFASVGRSFGRTAGEKERSERDRERKEDTDGYTQSLTKVGT